MISSMQEQTSFGSGKSGNGLGLSGLSGLFSLSSLLLHPTPIIMAATNNMVSVFISGIV